MVNVPKLRGIIAEKGMSIPSVAIQMGISPRTLNRKLKKAILDSDDIDKLLDILDLHDPVPVFFTQCIPFCYDEKHQRILDDGFVCTLNN